MTIIIGARLLFSKSDSHSIMSNAMPVFCPFQHQAASPKFTGMPRPVQKTYYLLSCRMIAGSCTEISVSFTEIFG
jgi:hypothetical protein